MKKGYTAAKEQYDTKRIFHLKLKGEPLDLQRKTLVKDMRWLLKHGIFSEKIEIFSNNYTGEYSNKYRYICEYPVRIWYFSGSAPYSRIKRDWLTPGETWTF